tara:strand:+ start:860 stop:1402 length:543 start_codon:yes stop_codon:yes gene_type:complete
MRKNREEYNDTRYDEMKNLLDKSRNIFEQVTGTNTKASLDLKNITLDRDEEKVKEYDVSSGKMIVRGYTTPDITLTDEEKNTFQETMDDFIEQVSDLVDYGPLTMYRNNVEWSGKLVKFDTEFFYSVGEKNGVYIIGSMIKVDEEFTEMINKLKDYYQVFSAKWAGVLADRKSTTTIEKE